MIRLFIYGLVSIALFNTSLLADIIVLSSGEQLEVTILNQDHATVQVHHAILGDFTIQTKDITSIEQPTSTLNQDAKPVSDVDAIEHCDTPESKWNQNIRLGLGFQKGQKESTDISTSYHADRTKNEHKVTFDIQYRFAESDHEKTLNRLASTWGNTWFQSNSRWDIFTNLQFDWAEFQSWDQRLLGDLGVQFEVIKLEEGTHTFTLSSRLGSGFRQEFNSEDDELIPEGLLGLLVDWSVSDKQTFTADSTWYPDYNDTSNYRLVSNAEWNMQIEDSNSLQFSIGLHHEHDSVVDPGIKKSELQLTAGIKYLF